jgi:hypothetical protein
LELTTRTKTTILNLTVIGIVRIGLHRPVSRTFRRVELKIPEVHVPAEISGTKLGNGIRGPGGRRKKGGCKKAGDNTPCEQAASQCRYQNVCCQRRHGRSPHHKEPGSRTYERSAPIKIPHAHSQVTCPSHVPKSRSQVTPSAPALPGRIAAPIALSVRPTGRARSPHRRPGCWAGPAAPVLGAAA